MAEEYTEEIYEAVKDNFDYLTGQNVEETALFLETLADSLYDGQLLEQVAAALRDIEEGY